MASSASTRTRSSAERAPDVPFYAASTVKLAVLVAAARALESGELTLDQQVRSTDRFASQVPGAPAYRIEPDDLDGHTIDELADYLDAGMQPADPSIDDSAACQNALAAIVQNARR